MPLVIPMKGVEETIILNEVDATGDTWVVVRQASTGDAESIDNTFAEYEEVGAPGENLFRIKRRWNAQELMRARVYHTLSACNIQTDGGKPWFEFKPDPHGVERPISKQQFDAAWKKLPTPVAEAIHKAVIRVNPQWDPEKKAQLETT